MKKLNLYNLVWGRYASRFIKRKLPQTKLYPITCLNIENIP